jgi:hypothetical protein
MHLTDGAMRCWADADVGNLELVGV